MKDKILKGKQKAIVTFAAVALMGSGVLLAAMPTTADDGTRHAHSMGKQFSGHLSENESDNYIGTKFNNRHAEDEQGLREHQNEARQHRSEAISGFLGISENELRGRVENGERIHDIAKKRGKTRSDFRAYMMQYMQKHHLFDS